MKTPQKSKKYSCEEVTLLDSDEDEEMRKALEESMKLYADSSQAIRASSAIQTTTTSARPSTSRCTYDEAIPAATPVESLPGFDNDAGFRWLYPTNYPVRKYQRDIVESCLFHNTLVCLPTGLGNQWLHNYYQANMN